MRRLGVCYYPEHWPERMWAADAARMAALGLSVVRIGEFAWERIEPSPGDLRWGWLDRAMAVLGEAGLGVVLGTPTATPPRWVLEKHPDMLPVGADGRARGFGSRRHYDFSHRGYRAETARIVELMAARYGRHPALIAWQTDNEYGCHDTTLSYSAAAEAAFRDWLADRYGQIDALNAAWGNVFWSMGYRTYGEIGLPAGLVTEANPAHAMAFRRFASEAVRDFNRAQVEIIRAHSDAPVAHNYMGRVTEFDHHRVAADMEIAAWDSYPLGFLLDRVPGDDAHRLAFARQGDPDFQAFHHDLYRGMGRLWVMEQQPGPVNWAPWNPAPSPGMVRLWGWEAFAHGAEVVSFFRWRQAPWAQEQMHAGLRRPDDAPAPGWAEVERLAEELAGAGQGGTAPSPVALIFDYESQWAWEIERQGADFDYFALVFAVYRALRRAGFSVDVFAAEDPRWAAAPLVFAPGLWSLPEAFRARLAEARGQVVLGPRAGAKTAEFSIPEGLPPGLPGLDLRVGHVESLPPGLTVPLAGIGGVVRWIEALEGGAETVLATAAGTPVAVRAGALTYLGAWLDDAALDAFVARMAGAAGLSCTPLPGAVRRRETGVERFYFNYSAESTEIDGEEMPSTGVLRHPI